MKFTIILKRYRFFLFAILTTILLTFFNKNIGLKSFTIALSSFKQMISVLPPIMIMLGLMDSWVSRETMMKYMGKNSGAVGILLSILIGSLAAGPMYAAFPFTTVLLQKGVRFSNILIFMNAWCVTKISTFLFELTALGYKFTFARLFINLPGIILMGFIIEGLLSHDELENIYLNAGNTDK
ncbi:permease [Clostridium peptidivorans]|uniref:permease n=1 Tax=Clostridium peptidivorans TaxID=100174 RepID=UPI000BE2DB88|nr:permease [Clostridium peptidivorans]